MADAVVLSARDVPAPGIEGFVVAYHNCDLYSFVNYVKNRPFGPPDGACPVLLCLRVLNRYDRGHEKIVATAVIHQKKELI
jgi:hypothetical protein